MKWAYYNELDEQKCAWIRELIRQGVVTDGEVDCRSIREVRADDLRGFRRVHLFAGIAIWDYSLNLARWGDREAWTFSCPCQPFSDAGKKEAFNDERHLWPVVVPLIAARRPLVCFGEQVSSADGLAWFDAVHADLDNAGYACGALDLCAAGVGAPHRRQRLYFVADAEGGDWQVSVLKRGPRQASDESRGRSGPCGESRFPSPLNGVWRDADWLFCRDGKWRPVEAGTFPLAHGAPARLGRLRGYGDGIVAPLAAEVVAAYMETER